MQRPITIKHVMEKLACHSGLMHIGALLNAINFRERFKTVASVHCVNPKMLNALLAGHRKCGFKPTEGWLQTLWRQTEPVMETGNQRKTLIPESTATV